mgnify:CR=1 FL=1
MANYEQEFKEYAGKLRAQVKGIDKILKLNMNGLLDASIEQKLHAVKEEANKLLKKLENNEFEISIVGLEKAGKSSFANALMGNDILPSKEARCTYTSTSIRYGNNEAKVSFFSREEFAKAFQKRLEQLGIEHPETYTYEQLTLENYRKLFDSLNAEKKQLYGASINKDIEDILIHKDNIRGYVGQDSMMFHGDQLNEEYFKGFIEDPQYAIAVKEITLRSDKLENMKNAIIYDVPGFDSPTQMHKDQTREKMSAADAIILIASAYKPSFTGPVVDIFQETDKDGVKYGNKLFVYANMADRAENLAGNMQDIRNDLDRYSIMDTQYFDDRILAGSAKASLQAAGKIEGTDAFDEIKRKGIDDGIKRITDKLAKYNKTDRFEVLKGRINRLQNDIRDIFKDNFKETEVDKYGDSRETSMLVAKMLDESRAKIKKEIDNYRDEFKTEYAPETYKLTNKMKTEVIDELSLETYQVTDEELEEAKKKNGSIVDVPIFTDIDKCLREKKYTEIYNAFSKGVISIAENEHNTCNEALEEIFVKGLGLTQDNPYYDELKEKIKEYIAKQEDLASSEGYYKSLVERFSIDLFELLVRYPYADISCWNRFDEAKENFYGLSMYSEDYDSGLPANQQPMLYTILFHDDTQKKQQVNVKKVMQFVDTIMNIGPYKDISQLLRIIVAAKGDKAYEIVQHTLENVVNFESNSEKINFARNALNSIVDTKNDDLSMQEPITKKGYEKFLGNKVDKSLDDIKNDINKDIDILQNVLEDTVVKAICMEKPFLALEIQIMNNIYQNIDSEEYRSFLVNNMPKICVEEYLDLSENEQKRKAYDKMMEAIKEILDEMRKSEE